MRKTFRISISYNAPVTLTYALVSALVLALNMLVAKLRPGAEGVVPLAFTAQGAPFAWKSALSYVRLFTHVFGHTDWNHYLGNFSFIILLGPLMEERYGSRMLALMFVATAFVTGVINACMIPYPLLGGSGIVFMLIILSSISSLDKKKIPLSFICVILIYFGRELYNALALHTSNISAVAHIAGGFCGSLFGFLVAPKGKKPSAASAPSGREKDRPSESGSASRKKSAAADGDVPLDTFLGGKKWAEAQKPSEKRKTVLSFRGKKSVEVEEIEPEPTASDSEIIGSLEF